MQVQLRRCLFILVFCSVAVACNKGATTTVPLSWENPGYESVVFKKLLVIGVATSEGSRRMFEDEFATALATQGATAQASWGMLPQTAQLTEEEIDEVVRSGGFDAVVVTRLLSVDESQEYVEGSSYSVPSNYYGYGYYGYYGSSYSVVHEPGYFKSNKTFRLETNLYAASDSGLVWSGQSETLNPESVADVIGSMTATVAEKLRTEGLIP